tara:strand:+ start:370 stop:555 length:186 start_codon:yes stop_codon:yes gene_type:complete
MELFFIIFSFFLFFFPNGVRMLFLKRKKKTLDKAAGLAASQIHERNFPTSKRANAKCVQMV